ncbi:MAG: hypothetical protein ACM3UR_05250 [Bacteroidota bacterium]|jgi:hypothetical protein|nr:hypothetical protein [Ignavibacteria bacterium]HEX2960363.1 hypothetical protein [Ignavibacteriales bacterium]MCU7499299.1 hypothetical protein [Ignavibacteria bacterium]MCU7512528.1 hypothetical protein [Ignavibacteria bacterium]MCU7519694.1 hypothetical protein [Ignavibacteria bacterium]
MKISTNNIGNYGPGYTQQVKAKPRINNEAAIGSLQKNEKINNEEKNFFINLYPENKKEITDYHFYQKSGKMSGVALGSLFDKRG